MLHPIFKDLPEEVKNFIEHCTLPALGVDVIVGWDDEENCVLCIPLDKIVKVEETGSVRDLTITLYDPTLPEEDRYYEVHLTQYTIIKHYV